MRIYELLFIVQPELEEEALANLVSGVQQAITNNGGEIINVEEMGRRRLAYPIKRRYEGVYILLHARMEQQAITELERYLRLSEDILRYLLIRVQVSEPSEGEEVDAEVEAEA